MDRVRNEDLCRRPGLEMELASRADQRVFRWWKEWMITVRQEGC